MISLRFILALIFTLSLAAGCSGGDQYSLEKEYWRLGRLSARIAVNPDATPWSEVERAISLFNGFIGRHPGTALSLNAEFSIARLYTLKGDPGKARGQLERIAEKYDSPEIRAEAYFLIGATYQENDRETAFTYYQRVLGDYPLTKRGLAVPLYIAEYYRDHFEPGNMVAAYNEAVNRYLDIAGKHPGTPLAFDASLLASACYGGLKDWRNSVNVLEGLLSEFKSKAKLDFILMNIALIYRNHLQDPARFRETLERLTREYPDSALVNTARALMKSEDSNGEKRD